MLELKVTVEGKAELLAAFLKVQRGVVDLRQLGTWDWVQSEFYKIEAEIFDTEGGKAAAGKWKALSPKYQKQKLRKYGAMPILQATGRLYRSMTSASGDSFVDKQAQEMTIGSKLPYARPHQFGGRNNLPARPYISFTDEQEKRLAAPIQAKLKQLIANAKLSDIRGF